MQQRMRGLGQIAEFACLCLLAACAGPMDPFGAKPLFSESLQQLDLQQEKQSILAYETSATEIQKRMPASISNTAIDFFPPRKLWHRSFDLTVVIKDQSGINNNSKVMFYYGTEDVTNRVASYARIKYSGDGTEVSYTIPAFRLLPEQDKTLMVAYAKLDPLGDDQVIGRVYEEPTCPMLDIQNIASTANLKGFQATDHLIEQIRSLASFNHINPALIAGLIAQESSFDSHAVSPAKALGLTQITAPAETHILEDLGERAIAWPRYPGLYDMNPIRIKALVALGRINASNEWRLSNDRSIQGGISYLRHIQGYWNNFIPLIDRRLASLNKRSKQDEIVDLILASYNSGSYRVRKDLERHGDQWLEAPDLGEARKYVHNVKSYCYDFARGY